MSDTNRDETFTERVDVTTQPDGAFIGTMEIDVRPGDDRHAERMQMLQGEWDRLRGRVAELERLLEETRTSE
jgi:hypothetical protein